MGSTGQSPMLPPVGTWQQYSDFLCLSFPIYERQGEGVALATPHPKLCDLEDLPGLPEPKPRLYTECRGFGTGRTGHLANCSKLVPHPNRTQAREHQESGAFSSLLSQFGTPIHQMLACCLAMFTQADKVPKTPHPGLGHEPLGSRPLTWGLHVPHSQQHPSREDPSWPAAPTTPALEVGFADPTAQPISQGVGPGPLVHMV
ncbi:uncharacterized protein LOC114201016 [Eumetopias jubatus]|uniref:uncharacterized protein LOC114201016 n=1 Tax=Eumetopias jubatus TaxID=34886 RepID=UPI001017063D|nr:uncharacterized protein LOC114201016 [Eumetopias jubatus]